jgi:hypothetical protein
MDYKELITRYINIETKYPLKTERKRKLDELLKDLHASKLNFSLEEIQEVISKLLSNNATIRMPLFSQVIYPVLNQGIENKEVKAIKLLLSLTQQLYQYQSFTKQDTHSSASLIQQGLQSDPNDKELLSLQESRTKEYLLYTLHELPTGVLYGQNSASIPECNELLEYVAEYEYYCHKLKLNRSDLIRECKFYYSAYKDYLIDILLHKNFKDYLTKNRRREE